jgi:hypothetical protein|nr:MAG TPA: hypothetical protein [Caudoviricetes sp.]
MNTKPIHFDLDALELDIRNNYAEQSEKARRHPKVDLECLAAQERLVDITVAINRWFASELMLGTDPALLFATTGMLAGRVINTGKLNAREYDAPGYLIAMMLNGMTMETNPGEDSISSGPKSFDGVFGGNA